MNHIKREKVKIINIKYIINSECWLNSIYGYNGEVIEKYIGAGL
jgi:hypothetical protein